LLVLLKALQLAPGDHLSEWKLLALLNELQSSVMVHLTEWNLIMYNFQSFLIRIL
jgi:hypothetical protein